MAFIHDEGQFLLGRLTELLETRKMRDADFKEKVRIRLGRGSAYQTVDEAQEDLLRAYDELSGPAKREPEAWVDTLTRIQEEAVKVQDIIDMAILSLRDAKMRATTVASNTDRLRGF
jgi:hypothetical protein